MKLKTKEKLLIPTSYPFAKRLGPISWEADVLHVVQAADVAFNRGDGGVGSRRASKQSIRVDEQSGRVRERSPCIGSSVVIVVVVEGPGVGPGEVKAVE